MLVLLQSRTRGSTGLIVPMGSIQVTARARYGFEGRAYDTDYETQKALGKPPAGSKTAYVSIGSRDSTEDYCKQTLCGE